MTTVRKISTNEKEIFLTFDDGPNEKTTPLILDVLAECKIKATFFVVANKFASSPQIAKRIQQDGHAIGNHSLDHKYAAFFLGKSHMKDWILRSETKLKDCGVFSNVGFRPPVGIRTPELFWALKQLQLPLILWNVRYYDSFLPWTQTRAIHSLKTMSAGSIILLHDDRSQRSTISFTYTLRRFIQEAQSQNFKFNVLTRTLCSSQASGQ